MFIGLIGLSNQASSMIGPRVIQAIIDKTGYNWMGFPFLFALCAAASLVIWFGVDVHKGQRDAAEWAREVRGRSLKAATNYNADYLKAVASNSSEVFCSRDELI